MSSPAPPPAAASAAPNATAPASAPINTETTAYDAGFDEDDEFEEFEDEDWAPDATEQEKKEVEWADDWDDDLVEGDFVVQLRQELSAAAAADSKKQ